MDIIKNRALTYSLLAHIRSKGQLTNGPVDIFVPLVKRTLSKLNEKGIFSGKTIFEIKTKADEIYAIDFPIPVIRKILGLISNEINTVTKTNFYLYGDDSFEIKNYAFLEYEEAIRIHHLEIENIDKLFREFCASCGAIKPNSSTLLQFIEKNKLALSKYLSHKQNPNGHDYTIEAQFVEFFKAVPAVYEIIRKIYLGSILSGFIEYKTEITNTNVELLFDTNFIIGLLDLNTKESTHTCQKIVDITVSQGYKLTILKDTIEETKYLLKAKADNFDLNYLQKKIYPEDIYNACERRNLNKADIERISDNLEEIISKFGVSIVHDTTKYKNKARFSTEFSNLKKYRHSEVSALHDATALYYVRDKRQKKIKEFENVNCWFINNTVNRDKYDDTFKNSFEYQPELIKADDFLNIIWLSNPQITKNLDAQEVSDIGLTSLISMGLTDSLPKLSIIRELDDNIQKYAADNGLTDGDIIKIATRITTKQLSDLDGLNKLANQDGEQFVKRLNQEAKKQKELEDERLKKLDKIFHEFSIKSKNLSKKTQEFEQKNRLVDKNIALYSDEAKFKDGKIVRLEEELQDLKSKAIAEKELKKEEYIETQLKKWRRPTIYSICLWIASSLFVILYFFYVSNWNINIADQNLKELKNSLLFSGSILIVGFIFTRITYKLWYDKYKNFSNIENFKKSLKIPKDFV